jgi:pimeloyl-ACP methyl ester carboxylesterase
MRSVSAGVIRQRVRTEGVLGTLFRPDTSSPVPAVLVLGGGEGGLVEGGALSLAEEGYAALALPYFGYGPLPRDLIEVPLEYFARALAWLRDLPGTEGRRATVLGTSRGGELALLLGATYPEHVGAVVGYVPSSVVYGGSSFDPWSAFAPSRSAWTLGGRPLPFVEARPRPDDFVRWRSYPSFVWPFFVTTPEPRFPISLLRAYERPLDGDSLALRRAAVPVERIAGPVLLVSGGRDALWPSSRLSEMAVSRLRFHRHPYRYEHLLYEEAGHMILPQGVSGAYVPPWLDVGGSPRADHGASADAWDRVLNFLGESLG